MVIVRAEMEKVAEARREGFEKELEELKGRIERQGEEIEYWRGKCEGVEGEYQKLEENFQAEKIHLLADSEDNLSELKAKYHRNKLLMLEASQQ